VKQLFKDFGVHKKSHTPKNALRRKRRTTSSFRPACPDQRSAHDLESGLVGLLLQPTSTASLRYRGCRLRGSQLASRHCAASGTTHECQMPNISETSVNDINLSPACDLMIIFSQRFLQVRKAVEMRPTLCPGYLPAAFRC
jgi:hypothetical protein